MPLDQPQLLALPAYEQAYVAELYAQLRPQALLEYRSSFLRQTVPRWQTQMIALVEVTGAIDASLPAYERAYVTEWYNFLRPNAEANYRKYILSRTPPEWQEDMLLQVSGGLHFEVVNYKSAVIAAGGTMTPAATTAYQNFVLAEKAPGCWDLTDDYWMLWGENTQQALISFKQRRAVVPVGNPTWIPSWGYQFDATTNYLNTGFLPATHKVAMGNDNQRGAAYIRGGQQTSAYCFGSQTGTSRGLWIRSRTAVSTMSGGAGSNSGSYTVAGDDTRGLVSVQRNGPAAANMTARRNGVDLPNSSPSTTFGVPPQMAIYIGALNSQGTTVWSGVPGLQIGFVAVGAAFTPAQAAAHYTNVQNLILALGAG